MSNIIDTDMNWKYGYEFYRARDLDGLDPTAASSSASLGQGASVFAEINNLEVAGMPMTPADEIHGISYIQAWDLDRAKEIEFNVIWIHLTQTTTDTPDFKLFYQFRSEGEALVIAQAAPDETVTLTAQGIDAGAAAYGWATSGWGRMDTPTYITTTDYIMQWTLELDALGGMANDDVDLWGICFRYTRASCTQIREVTNS